jgi:hypothetical protein
MMWGHGSAARLAPRPALGAGSACRWLLAPTAWASAAPLPAFALASLNSTLSTETCTPGHS